MPSKPTIVMRGESPESRSRWTDSLGCTPQTLTRDGAMAALAGVDFLEIDYEEYLLRVKAKGCFGNYSRVTFAFDNTYRMYLNKMKALGRVPDKKYERLALNERICEPISFDADTNFHQLKTDAPGVAIWSCYISQKREMIRERLYNEMINTDDKLFKYNCAIALGLVEDKRALPVLRDIVQNRDCFFFTDNRRSNQFRSAIALCLIGRLGDLEDLPLLFDILSAEEIERQMYHTLQPNYLYHTYNDRNFVYFVTLTYACMAIYKIYKRCDLDMRQLHNYFCALFSDDTILNRVIEDRADSPAKEEMKEFVEYVLHLTGHN